MESKSSQSEGNSSSIRVDRNGFVYADGVRVARYLPEKKSLQFLDKDRKRSSARGSRYVEVSISEVASLGSE